jgi:Xaa-Pro aminopeptidase
MADRRAERLVALRRKLGESHLDALIVSSLPSIRYLTGFSGSSGLLCVSAGTALFYSDFRYREQAAAEIGDLAVVSIDNGSAWERLFLTLASHVPSGSVGYEADHLTAREAVRLSDPSRPWRFTATGGLVEKLRAAKSPEEIEAIRAAGSVATAALGATAAQVRAGMTELEVAALLEGALRRGGSEWFPFPTIVASGPRSALPHARTSSRVVAPGDFLLIDFGAIVDGYCSDVTRTFVVGAEPTERQREVHGVVQQAHRAALGGLRPGLSGRQGDALARDVIVAAGYGDAFGHSLGHGVGLEVHEGPRLARTADEVLEPSAVVTVEPGVYLEGWGGVRIEDDAVLRPAGAELLTEYPRELMRLG